MTAFHFAGTAIDLHRATMATFDLDLTAVVDLDIASPGAVVFDASSQSINS